MVWGFIFVTILAVCVVAGDVVTKLVNEESDFLLDELPHTGSVSMLVCMVCGGISLIVGGLLLYSGKKKWI